MAINLQVRFTFIELIIFNDQVGQVLGTPIW